MFTTAIRSQSQVALSSLRLGRAPAVSSLRNFSSFLLRQATAVTLPAPSLTRLSGVSGVSRSFSRSAVAYISRPVHNNPPSHILFVGNLPWSATKVEVEELFGQYGEVADVRLRV